MRALFALCGAQLAELAAWRSWWLDRRRKRMVRVKGRCGAVVEAVGADGYASPRVGFGGYRDRLLGGSRYRRMAEEHRPDSGDAQANE
eukprot:609175-Prymnesium_polylepis.1